MIKFLINNLSTIIISVILLLIVASIIYKQIANRKKGKHHVDVAAALAVPTPYAIPKVKKVNKRNKNIGMVPCSGIVPMFHFARYTGYHL